eukprot:15454965-Alexandrium_andersonii.AAC.1
MRTCVGRSKLELHGPRNGLKFCPRSSREVCSAPSFCAAAGSADEAGRRARRRCFSGGSGGPSPPGRLL